MRFNRRDSRTVVLAAVSRNGMSLAHASALRDDRDVVLAAVQQNGLALQFASEALRADSEVLAAVKNPIALRF